jgi:hypothetical protein
MRSHTISLLGVLVIGLTVGWFFAPVMQPQTLWPSGELRPTRQVIEAGMSLEVDLHLKDRPRPSIIEWHAERGAFAAPETDTDLRRTFIAPPEQGPVTLWVDVISGDRSFRRVATVRINVARSSASIPATTSAPARAPSGPGASSGGLPIEQTGSPRAAMVSPSIKFITVPRYDPVGGASTTADIDGVVDGVSNPDQLRVVIYAKTGNTWWVQPLVAAPYSSIDRHGQFETWTHTGTDYAAILVRKGFEPPTAIDGRLPESPDILARVEVPGIR